MDRTERLLDLVALLLDSREPVSFAELREAFPDDYGAASRESAERKLERDKAELHEIGVPIEFVPPDEDRELGGYRIDRKAFFLPNPRLMPEEAAALYAAGSAALAAHDFPFAQDLSHALRKISLAAGGPLDGGGPAARRLLVVRPGDPARAAKLRTLAQAVARRKRARIVYRAPPQIGHRSSERVTSREVDPYGLAFRSGAWRLVGYCHLRKAERVFVVDRIESLQMNEQRPNLPDFEVPAGFDAGAAAGRRPWEFTGAAPAEVTLRFAPGSEMLAERAFDAKAEGGRLRLRVSFLEGLIPHVLSFGDRVWIDGPAEARARARAALLLLEERLAREPNANSIATPNPTSTPNPNPTSTSNPNPAPTSNPTPTPTPTATPNPPSTPNARERLRRLLLVVPAARRNPGIKVEPLARELGLDPQDLLADIDLLAMVGRPPFSPDDLIDIGVDESGRVTVALDQSFSRPPQLTPLEALALAAAAQAVAPADPAVESALAKLTGQLPSAARSLYAALAQRVTSGAPPPRGTSEMLARLRRVAEQRREVALDYDKEGRGASEERLLRPYAVIDHRGRWYVYGFDVGRGAERTFRLDRIRAVRETGKSFADPGPLDLTRFQRETLFFPTGAETPAVLRFSGAAASWALSRYGARGRSLPDGGAEVVLDSAGTSYAVSVALSFAGEAELIDPPEARAALRAEVERALSRYAD